MMQLEQDQMAPLRNYLAAMTRLVETANGDETRILNEGGQLLQQLVASDDWLPEYCAKQHAQHYMQYLLYCDPLERFSVVSFVWGPGQTTPVHDHTVWGLVGILRGAEIERSYRWLDRALVPGEEVKLLPGVVSRLSPRDGDIHQVSNAFQDRVSVSIHVYGANIGKVSRSVFDAATGTAKSFVSGYSNDVLPNAWTA
jgi:predicted metal-dependent enzyme (double-stranded beta helix superfamily)